MQASELQEMNKLIKEAESLRAMADTAGIAVSDVEDCGSEDGTTAVYCCTFFRTTVVSF